MQNTFWTALLTSLVSAFVTCLGIYTIRRCTAWGQRNITYFMCFAAGVLISAFFLHIIPKSLAMTPHAPVWLLVGFFGLDLFNRFLTSLVCEKDPEKKDFVIGVIPMLGIGLHSLIDGIIYSMPKTAAFEAHHHRFEKWFETHEAAYISELLALRPFVPWQGQGIEIGVGSGRFAAPLSVQTGVDPSSAMLRYAAERGIRVVEATAEHLPFAEGRFDHVLVVTTLCFVDSPPQMLAESRRVLKPGGRLVR